MPRKTRSVAVAGVPSEPNVYYFGATGGVWKTTDAGMSWQPISDGQFRTSSVGAIAVADSDPLRRGPKAGAVDLAMHPANPRVLYATFWEVSRNPWHFSSGGPGSGLFKSTDGGDVSEIQVQRDQDPPLCPDAAGNGCIVCSR